MEHRTCPECGRTLTQSPRTEGCGACERADRATTELLEEAVALGIIERVGVSEHGQIVCRGITPDDAADDDDEAQL